MPTRRQALAATAATLTAGCLDALGGGSSGPSGTTEGFAATLLDGDRLIRLENRGDRRLGEFFTVTVLSEDPAVLANGAPGDPLPPSESTFLYRRGDGPAAQIGASDERPADVDPFVPFDARPLHLQIRDGSFRTRIPVETS